MFFLFGSKTDIAGAAENVFRFGVSGETDSALSICPAVRSGRPIPPTLDVPGAMKGQRCDTPQAD